MKTILQLITVSASLAAVVPALAGEFQFEQLADRVEVRLDGTLFTAYRFADRRPCLYPVIGPGGQHLTRRWPLEPDAGQPESHDHPHHTGLWYAHGAVRPVGETAFADFWHQDRIVHQRFVDFETQADHDTLVAESAWTRLDGVVLCTSRTRIQFGRAAHARWIDFQTAITAPADTAIVFGDTKEGTLAIRVPETLTLETGDKALQYLSKGHITTSEGVIDDKAWGTRARWCAYHGPVDGKPTVIALMDHPANPRHPTWWVARPYGLLTANAFGKSFFENAPAGAGDFTIPAGDTVTFRHRFLFLDADFEPAAIEDAYRRFAE